METLWYTVLTSPSSPAQPFSLFLSFFLWKEEGGGDCRVEDVEDEEGAEIGSKDGGERMAGYKRRRMKRGQRLA